MKIINKSSERSEFLRGEGNQFYAQKKFYDALLKYNESLCHAMPQSENLRLAFANRSAVYFEMKLYDKCLQNVELARQNCYPEKNFEILKRREEKCLELMKPSSESKSPDYFKLSYPPHKTIPFIADCLELKNDEKYGRHIVTNRPLKTGDFIAIDEPFCKVVHYGFIHQRCAGCHVADLMSLMPCEGCRKTMFCMKCNNEASKAFHELECPIMEVLSESFLTPTMQMAIRTFLAVLKLFDGSIENLEKFLSENADSKTIFDFDGSIDPKQKFLAINSLVSDDENEVNTTVYEDIFVSSPTLNVLWKSNSAFIRNFLSKHTKIGRLNYHEIYNWPLKRGGLPDEEFQQELNEFKGAIAYKRGVMPTGNGSYPFLSLINHSCASNVDRIFIDSKIIIVVTRSVEKGGQLFDNYGFNFTNLSKDQRQASLQSQYGFTCQCIACVSDWPFLTGLKVVDKTCFNHAKQACRDLPVADYNKKKAMEKFRELSGIIEKARKGFPSVEICSLMQSSSAFLEMSLKPQILFP